MRTNPGTGQQVTEIATVLSANEGVVLKIGDRIEVLRDDGVPTRVIFAKVPDNLRAQPTLSVTVDQRPRRRAAGDAQLPDHRARLEGRLCRAVRRARRRSSTCRAGSR